MTHTEIEAFLAVCRNKTITAAAHALHIEQSSLSARLKTLESDLGGPLFLRRRGSREITLTRAGQAFYELAVQYEDTVRQMRQVFHVQPGTLRISSFNSLGTYLLPETCDRFLQTHPDTDLEIQDMELEACSRYLQDGRIDLAFTTAGAVRRGLVRTPLFSEPMIFVSASHYPEPVTADRLSVRHEAYIRWSAEYDDWHRGMFGQSAPPKFRISMIEQLTKLLREPQSWAIVPLSVVDALDASTGIRRYETAFPLPRRTISFVTAKAPANRECIQAFLTCLRDQLADWPEINLFQV